MDDNQKEWINAVRREVHNSEFESDHKSALQRQLDSAAKLLNGTPDKMAIMFESTAEKIVRDVRQEITLVAEIKKHVDVAIQAHAKGCQFKKRPGIIGIFDRIYDQSPIMALVILIWFFQSGHAAELIKLLGLN